MKPVASRSLTSSSSTPIGIQPLPTTTNKSPSPTPPISTPKPSTFKEAKQARENVKPSRASGGIFRPSGDHSIFDKGEKQGSQSPGSSSSTKPSPSATVNGASQKTSTTNGFSPTKPPMTLFNFTRSWESLESTEQRWNLISVSQSDIGRLSDDLIII
jgi:RNA polymerase II-associated protein 3